MKDFFDILNSTSGERLFGYFLILIFVLAISFEGIAKIVKAFKKPKV